MIFFISANGSIVDGIELNKNFHVEKVCCGPDVTIIAHVPLSQVKKYQSLILLLLDHFNRKLRSRKLVVDHTVIDALKSRIYNLQCMYRSVINIHETEHACIIELVAIKTKLPILARHVIKIIQTRHKENLEKKMKAERAKNKDDDDDDIEEVKEVIVIS